MHPLVSNEQFLDETIDEFLEAAAEGLELPVDERIRVRPHLADEILDLCRCVRVTAVQSPKALPEIAGHQVLGPLGQGGMGSVVLARQPGLGRLVALKILPLDGLASARGRGRFDREAKTLAALKHPGIVTVYGALEDEGVRAYSMEWIDGPTLAQVLNRIKERTEEPKDDGSGYGFESFDGTKDFLSFHCGVAIAMARALSLVHQHGLVHRDVSPRNVLFRADGSPVLTDFGLVRGPEATSVTQSGEFLGTALYAAPEQLRGDQDSVGPAVDQYALAMILFEALSGAHPDAGIGRADAILRRREAGPPSRLKSAQVAIPRDLQTVLQTALNPAPRDRYPNIGQFADDLERVLAHRPIKAQRPTLAKLAYCFIRRHLLATTLVAVGLILAAVLALWLLNQQREAFLRPQRVAEAVRKAQLQILDPNLGASLFAALGQSHSASNPAPLELEEALAHYDSALRLDPQSTAVSLERSVISLAMRLRRKSNFGYLPTGLETLAPITHAWVQDRRAEPPADATLAQAGTQDLRCLGLLAYLMGNVETCLRAIEDVRVQELDDPLVAAALGELHLLLHAPERATFRLIRAANSYPEAGHLLVNAADAACQVGELTLAKSMIAKAAHKGHHDQFRSLDRVRADIFAAEGKSDEALIIYEHVGDMGPTARSHYADLLMKLGQTQKALRLRLKAYRTTPRIEHYFHELQASAAKWWISLSHADQLAQIQSSLSRAPKGDLLYSVLQALSTSPRHQSEKATESTTVPKSLPVQKGNEGSDLSLPLTWEFLDMSHRENLKMSDEWAGRIASALHWADEGGRGGIGRALAPCLRSGWKTVSKLSSILAIVWMTAAPGAGQVLSLQTITTGVGGFTPSLSAGDSFGIDTLPLGDLNADGRPDFLMTAFERGSQPEGAVFMVSLNTNGTVFSATEYTATNIGFTTANGSTFMGHSMAMLGDLDGNGTVEVAISGHQATGGGPGTNTARGVLAIVSISSSLSIAPLRLIGGSGYGGSGFTEVLDTFDTFSQGVGNIGDVDGNGVIDLAVTSRDDDGGANSGAVYILFLDTSAQVIAHQKISNLSGGLVPGTFQPGSYACYGPSGLGDLDGDGVPDMAVGAPADDDGGMDRGAVHILYLNTNGTVKSQAKISDTQGGLTAGLLDSDGMGFASPAPDIDGDGIPELAVACASRSGTGSAFILFLNANGTVRTHVEIGPASPVLSGILSAGDQAGIGLRVIDDLDGDGRFDMLFPARLADTVGTDAGEVHVLFLDDLVPSSVLYPGNDNRFTLSTGLNASPCTTGAGEDSKTAAANDILRVCLDCDPILYGSPIILACDIVPGGAPQTGGLIPGFWLNLFSPNFIFLAGAPGSSPLIPAVTIPGGTTYAFLLPGALTGLDVVIQSALINPAQVPGGAAFSDAHVISMP